MTERNGRKLKTEQQANGDKITVLSGFATLVFASVLMAIGFCLFFYAIVSVIHFANPALYAATQLMRLTQNASSLMLCVAFSIFAVLTALSLLGAFKGIFKPKK